MDTLRTQVLGADCAERLVLTMEPGKFPQLEIVQNGVAHYKTVGWHQLLNLLDHSIVVEQLKKVDVRTTKIPRLPERTLLVDTEETPSWLDVTLTGWVPGLEYAFMYQDKSFLVRIPTMVYQVRWSLHDKKLKALRLAVTIDESVTVDSPLYRWPFSNVYPSGNVCWTFDVECELHQVVERAVFGFLGTPNNSDLFGQSRSQNSPYRDYESFLSTVQDVGDVPAEWLIPMQQTVAEFHETNRPERY
ncbi:MAG: prokaryotic E2 ligase family D protein [Alicyclobacillus sp.]|nr:prokaryotic E2 ligase family D protein [Alicyclobacillus sp.]